MRKILTVAVAVLCAAVLPASAAMAKNPHSPVASGFTLFGDAMLVHPGNASPTAAEATSTGPNLFGGVDFAFPAGLTVSQLNNLATDYQFVAGTCGQGSPRFVATVTNGTASGNINFYIGPPPNYNSCPPGVYANTGNLAAPTNLVDDSQLPGGTFYDPYAAAQTKYGSYTVTDVFLAVDGPNQTVDFDNSQVNSELFTYESAGSCKDGGYAAFTSSPGPFKNQGDCVSYFNNGK
jgi:hypothetical protein